MWKHVRTILVVTVVSVLVWMFAEAETLREQRMSLALSLRVPDGMALVMEAADTGTREVQTEVVLEGSAARMEGAQRALREALVISPGMEGMPSKPGDYEVDLAGVLRTHRVLQDAGVGVKRVEPAVMKVRIEELVEVELPVIVKGDADFQTAPVVTPPKIRLFAPRSEAINLGVMSVATVTLEAQDLARLVPGRPETLTGLRVKAPTELAGSTRARVEPARVDVTVSVRNRTAEITVARVPVHVRLAPSELAGWDISLPEQERFLIDVKVTGSPDVLAQIESKALPIVAVVALSYDELERAAAAGGGAAGQIVKEAVFSDAPAGVRFESAGRTVHVGVTRRAAALPRR